MDRIQMMINAIDYALNSKSKRHLVGGILLSVSLLFGGLALTSFTLQDDIEEEEKVEVI